MKRSIPLVLALLVSLVTLSLTALTSPETATAGAWKRRVVYEDHFSGRRLHRGWSRYHGPFSSGAENYARRDHFRLNGRGQLVLLMKHRRRGQDGAAWYTGGAMLKEKFGGRYQSIVVRYKVVRQGVRSHRNIPIRWVDDPDYEWYEGETNFNEGASLRKVSTFLHYDEDDQVTESHRANMTKWHRWRFVHRPDRRIRVFRDGKLVWDYQGTAETVPDAFRRIVLQQEVASGHPPTGRKGRERILIDYMKVTRITRG
jgi:hypothetical protein